MLDFYCKLLYSSKGPASSFFAKVFVTLKDNKDLTWRTPLKLCRHLQISATAVHFSIKKIKYFTITYKMATDRNLPIDAAQFTILCFLYVKQLKGLYEARGKYFGAEVLKISRRFVYER
jgi:hypothetical protein